MLAVGRPPTPLTLAPCLFPPPVVSDPTLTLSRGILFNYFEHTCVGPVLAMLDRQTLCRLGYGIVALVTALLPWFRPCGVSRILLLLMISWLSLEAINYYNCWCVHFSLGCDIESNQWRNDCPSEMGSTMSDQWGIGCSWGMIKDNLSVRGRLQQGVLNPQLQSTLCDCNYLVSEQ